MTETSDDQHETNTNYFTSTITSKYSHTLFYSTEHNEWLSSVIYDALELQPGHILIDMGCGPALESKIILKKMENKIRVIGVDPSQDMLDELSTELDSNLNIETVCMDAVAFSQSSQYSPYDRIFLKAMAHLLPQEERLIAFKGFYKQLVPKNGKLVIVHNTSGGKNFPFDERTKTLFGKLVGLETLLDELKQAGFKQIQQEIFTYEFPSNSIKAEDWIYLIENRLWTIFSKENINEQQMTDLINHVRKQYESPINFQMKTKQTITKCCAE